VPSNRPRISASSILAALQIGFDAALDDQPVAHLDLAGERDLPADDELTDLGFGLGRRDRRGRGVDGATQNIRGGAIDVRRGRARWQHGSPVLLDGRGRLGGSRHWEA
jgi:hypothetical protein